MQGMVHASTTRCTVEDLLLRVEGVEVKSVPPKEVERRPLTHVSLKASGAHAIDPDHVVMAAQGTGEAAGLLPMECCAPLTMRAVQV